MAMKVEHLGCRRGGFARFVVRPSPHRAEQLTRILEITLPKHGGALAGEAKCSVGCYAVIGDDHAFRWRRAGFRAPTSGASLACLGPLNRWELTHDGNLSV